MPLWDIVLLLLEIVVPWLLIVLVLVVLGLLAIMPAMEIASSTQVLSRSGFAEGGD